MPPIIKQLFIYPIKSCAGIEVHDVQFDHKGPLLDRRWMLVEASSGQFLSQREIPEMALISTAIEGVSVVAKQSFNVNVEPALHLPVDGFCVDVRVWEDDVKGSDCGDNAAAWFSALLGISCRLIFQGDQPRLVDAKYAKEETQVSFADGFPLLVVAQSSIDVLNGDCKDADIVAENFRPNIVVENTEAFVEVQWSSLTAEAIGGDVVMSVVKRCQRCVIPLLNTKTAEREKAILPVLLQHCREEGKIYFGQNLTFKIRDGVSLSVGQSLVIDSR